MLSSYYVSVIPLSKSFSKYLGSCESAILLEQDLFRCLIARVIVFLPVKSPAAVLVLM
jgi:hypothetical protein